MINGLKFNCFIDPHYDKVREINPSRLRRECRIMARIANANAN